MIDKMLKMGGCSSVGEFYKKYPSEQHFFNAFPGAVKMFKALPNKKKGGSTWMAPNFFDNGGTNDCSEGMVPDGFGGCMPDPTYQPAQQAIGRNNFPSKPMVYQGKNTFYSGPGTEDPSMSNPVNSFGRTDENLGPKKVFKQPGTARNTDRTQVWNTFNNIADSVDFTLAGASAITNYLDQKDQDKRNKKRIRDANLPDNAAMMNPLSRGDYEINNGIFRPDEMGFKSKGQYSNAYYNANDYPYAEDGIIMPVQDISASLIDPSVRAPEARDIAMAPVKAAKVVSKQNTNNAQTNFSPEMSNSFSEYASKAQHYIQAINPYTDITGDMLAAGAQKAFSKFGKIVPVELAVAQLQQEGYIANSAKKNKPQRTKNPFNVGNTDNGSVVKYNNIQNGIDAYFNLIASQYLNNKEPQDLLNNFVNKKGHRYASDKNYEKSLSGIISAFQNKAYGGQVDGGYGLDLNTSNTTGNNQSESNKDLRTTLPAIDKEDANVEAEKGETVMADFDQDGFDEHMVIGGNKHSKGGTPLNLPDGAFIFSDTKKLKIKNPAILKSFGKPIKTDKSYTPAQLAKQYDINKYKAILEDPSSDKIAKNTAQLMIDNYQKKLGDLALIQESMKGFPQGVPEMSQEAAMSTAEMAYGGYFMADGGNTSPIIPPHKGDKNAPRKYQQAKGLKKGFNKFDYSWLTAAGYENTPDGLDSFLRSQGYTGDLNSTKAIQKWLIDENVSRGNYKQLNDVWSNPHYGGVTNQGIKNGLTEDAANYPPLADDQDLKDNPIQPGDFRYDSMYKNWIDGAAGIRTTNLAKLLHRTPAPKIRTTVPGKLKITTSSSIPVTDPVPAPTVPDFTESKSKIPYDWTRQDKRDATNAMIDYGTLKKYTDINTTLNPVLPDATFMDWRARAAARQSQTNSLTNQLGIIQSPTSFTANASYLAGQNAEGVVQDIANTDAANVQIANGVSGQRAGILNQTAQINAQNKDQNWANNNLYDAKYREAERAARKGVVQTINQGQTNASTLYNMNISESPYYYIDPRMGTVKFNSEGAKAAFNNELRGAGTADTSQGDLGEQYNTLYTQYSRALTGISDPKLKHDTITTLVNKRLGLTSKNTEIQYPTDPVRNKSVRTTYGQ